MTRWAVALLMAMGLGSATALAADPPANTAARPATAAPSTDVFLTKTAAGNLFEIESSKLALSKTKSEQIRTFANEMVKDHTAAGTKFKQAVSEAKLKAPAEALAPEQQTTMVDLKAEEGPAFERDYVNQQYKAHVQTVDMFQAYADNGDNPRLKQFAREMLPTLKTHLDHATNLRSSLK